jgi:hypothetical protein
MKPNRNKKGEFTHKYPVGTTAYFSRLEDGKPVYGSGQLIIVGRGTNGIATTIKYATYKTLLHKNTIKLDDWKMTGVRKLKPEELSNLIADITHSIETEEHYAAYNGVGKQAVDLLKLVEQEM